MSEADATSTNGTSAISESQDVQQTRWNKRSKLSPDQLVLVVLISLLAAAVFALGVTVFYLMNNKVILSLTKENEDLRRNLSATASKKPLLATCPPPPEVKNETCLKCGAGWELHGGTCYKFITRNSSWTESRRSCKDLGGDLVKIDSREEQESPSTFATQMFLEEKLKQIINQADDSFWIGLTDSETEGKWLWVDGSPLNQSLSFWGSNQPDQAGGGESSEVDCVRMLKKENSDRFLWFDRHCNDYLRSVCEKAAETQLCFCV
ncbi:C-type lectin domain family 4 member E [Fundulus heteroclitus]|uniref:C-type lectin domain family 4 member E n=1 Tax=Fundulus heteroclitus TaxID=8078 RepID=UPI00165A75DB|nr:C-type lectin domain family 4 member E [Fundulus heteroclitus]